MTLHLPLRCVLGECVVEANSLLGRRAGQCPSANVRTWPPGEVLESLLKEQHLPHEKEPFSERPEWMSWSLC